MPHIIINIQTTGLESEQGHKIVEICAVKLNKNLTLCTQIFHTYLNPQRPISLEAEQINGISDDMLVGKPLFTDVVADLFAFIQDNTIIAHHEPFVVKFIQAELAKLPKHWQDKYQQILKDCRIIDTLLVCQDIWPYQSNSLNEVCRRLNINLNCETKFRAQHKVMLLAQVYKQIHSGHVNSALNLNAKNNLWGLKFLAVVIKNLILLLLITTTILFGAELITFLWE